MKTVKVWGSADVVEVDHGNSVDLSKGDKSKISLEVGNDNDSPISNEKVGETQSRVVKNNVNRTGVDIVDDGSSLTNWMINIHNKLEQRKRAQATRILILVLVTLIQIQLLLVCVGDLGKIYYECQSWE